MKVMEEKIVCVSCSNYGTSLLVLCKIAICEDCDEQNMECLIPYMCTCTTGWTGEDCLEGSRHIAILHGILCNECNL